MAKMSSCLNVKFSALDDESDEENPIDDHTANPTTMAKFAAAMMRELNSLPLDKYEVQEKPQFRLRVGMYRYVKKLDYRLRYLAL